MNSEIGLIPASLSVISTIEDNIRLRWLTKEKYKKNITYLVALYRHTTQNPRANFGCLFQFGLTAFFNLVKTSLTEDHVQIEERYVEDQLQQFCGNWDSFLDFTDQLTTKKNAIERFESGSFLIGEKKAILNLMQRYIILMEYLQRREYKFKKKPIIRFYLLKRTSKQALRDKNQKNKKTTILTPSLPPQNNSQFDFIQYNNYLTQNKNIYSNLSKIKKSKMKKIFRSEFQILQKLGIIKIMTNKQTKPKGLTLHQSGETRNNKLAKKNFLDQIALLEKRFSQLQKRKKFLKKKKKKVKKKPNLKEKLLELEKKFQQFQKLEDLVQKKEQTLLKLKNDLNKSKRQKICKGKTKTKDLTLQQNGETNITIDISIKSKIEKKRELGRDQKTQMKDKTTISLPKDIIEQEIKSHANQEPSLITKEREIEGEGKTEDKEEREEEKNKITKKREIEGERKLDGDEEREGKRQKEERQKIELEGDIQVITDIYSNSKIQKDTLTWKFESSNSMKNKEIEIKKEKYTSFDEKDDQNEKKYLTKEINNENFQNQNTQKNSKSKSQKPLSLKMDIKEKSFMVKKNDKVNTVKKRRLFKTIKQIKSTLSPRKKKKNTDQKFDITDLNITQNQRKFSKKSNEWKIWWDLYQEDNIDEETKNKSNDKNNNVMSFNQQKPYLIPNQTKTHDSKTIISEKDLNNIEKNNDTLLITKIEEKLEVKNEKSNNHQNFDQPNNYPIIKTGSLQGSTLRRESDPIKPRTNIKEFPNKNMDQYEKDGYGNRIPQKKTKDRRKKKGRNHSLNSEILTRIYNQKIISSEEMKNNSPNKRWSLSTYLRKSSGSLFLELENQVNFDNDTTFCPESTFNHYSTKNKKTLILHKDKNRINLQDENITNKLINNDWNVNENKKGEGEKIEKRNSGSTFGYFSNNNDFSFTSEIDFSSSNEDSNGFSPKILRKTPSDDQFKTKITYIENLIENENENENRNENQSENGIGNNSGYIKEEELSNKIEFDFSSELDFEKTEEIENEFTLVSADSKNNIENEMNEFLTKNFNSTKLKNNGEKKKGLNIILENNNTKDDIKTEKENITKKEREATIFKNKNQKKVQDKIKLKLKVKVKKEKKKSNKNKNRTKKKTKKKKKKKKEKRKRKRKHKPKPKGNDRYNKYNTLTPMINKTNHLELESKLFQNYPSFKPNINLLSSSTQNLKFLQNQKKKNGVRKKLDIIYNEEEDDDDEWVNKFRNVKTNNKTINTRKPNNNYYTLNIQNYNPKLFKSHSNNNNNSNHGNSLKKNNFQTLNNSFMESNKVFFLKTNDNNKSSNNHCNNNIKSPITPIQEIAKIWRTSQRSKKKKTIQKSYIKEEMGNHHLALERVHNANKLTLKPFKSLKKFQNNEYFSNNEYEWLDYSSKSNYFKSSVINLLLKQYQYHNKDFKYLESFLLINTFTEWGIYHYENLTKENKRLIKNIKSQYDRAFIESKNCLRIGQFAINILVNNLYENTFVKGKIKFRKNNLKIFQKPNNENDNDNSTDNSYSNGYSNDNSSSSSYNSSSRNDNYSEKKNSKKKYDNLIFSNQWKKKINIAINHEDPLIFTISNKKKTQIILIKCPNFNIKRILIFNFNLYSSVKHNNALFKKNEKIDSVNPDNIHTIILPPLFKPNNSLKRELVSIKTYDQLNQSLDISIHTLIEMFYHEKRVSFLIYILTLNSFPLQSGYLKIRKEYLRIGKNGKEKIYKYNKFFRITKHKTIKNMFEISFNENRNKIPFNTIVRNKNKNKNINPIIFLTRYERDRDLIVEVLQHFIKKFHTKSTDHKK
ncbi:hypothetical protein M0812_28089 [Anaeramoeba flamelloides]|uniref:Uncharacterized protein n=1 Tax=Anaeramoeba flamelloides TaxID=1746091 RepID=A0AAV7YAJ3_9EUKA|nr:hypothetical protein M0812_28089 [Anaeramoeba flamelloides]